MGVMQLDWIPIFSSIVDSTLWEEPVHVRLMFLTMMFMKDPGDHIVREPLRRISKVANLDKEPKKAYELAHDALKVLSGPDKRSLDPQPKEGRRIEWVDGQGWRVINGEYYEKMRRELGARIRKTQLQKQRREKERDRVKGKVAFGPSPGENAAVNYGVEIHEHRTEKPTEEEVAGSGVGVSGRPAVASDAGAEVRGVVRDGGQCGVEAPVQRPGRQLGSDGGGVTAGDTPTEPEGNQDDGVLEQESVDDDQPFL